MKIDSRRAIFEFLSIVIAVVLAMALTEARQNYLNRKEAQNSYESILEEIAENRGDLISDSTTIGQDVRYLDVYLGKIDSGESPGEFSLGFTLSFLKSSALEVAKINESMAFLPNETNMRISGVYQTQEFYAEKAKEIFNVMASMNSVNADMQSKEFVAKLKEYHFQLRILRSTIQTYLEETESFSNELDSLNALK